MSDGLIGAASIFTWTSDPPTAVSSSFFSLSTKPKRDVNVTQARQGIFGSNHLPKVGQGGHIFELPLCGQELRLLEERKVQ